MSLPAASAQGLERWMQALEARHLADLRFAEVTRALRAVSAAYVERRATLAARGVFDTAGKRAAYALFYGPLHFLTVSGIVRQLAAASTPVARLVDWGCGTGAASAAWASALAPAPPILALDSHPWAVAEARATYEAFGLHADVRRGDVSRARLPEAGEGLIAGWVLNELHDAARQQMLSRMLQAGARGTRVLVVEPIATRISPWWPEWAEAFVAAGGRADEWRIVTELPDLARRLDRAAGLRHEELTARSLWIS